MSDAVNDPHFYDPYTKRGNTPALCVLGGPYCECKDGNYCKRLPDSEDQDEAQ